MKLMQRWVSFGASEIGPAHIITGKPNQDSWASFCHNNCEVLVVSDGMGSKDFSEFGSAMACRAVDQAICKLLIEEGTANLKDSLLKNQLLNSIRDIWLDGIAPLTSSNASATCLFAYCSNEGTIWVGMLGDGLAAAVLNDGNVKVLEDSKDGSFSNMTQSLSEKTISSDWKIMSMPDDYCKAIMLCTDGVADDLEDSSDFASSFVDYFCKLPVITAASEASDMLIDWPTPKHSDDKTIACIFRREYPDE